MSETLLVTLALTSARGRAGGAVRRPDGPPSGALVAAYRPAAQPQLPTDVQGLRGEVQALRTEVSDALRHLAVVRYDAFGDMGGHLSWSLALLDDAGNGVVLTSIHGRSDARTYAKNVSDWVCDQQLSPEEEEAIKFARTAA